MLAKAPIVIEKPLKEKSILISEKISLYSLIVSTISSKSILEKLIASFYSHKYDISSNISDI